MAEYARVNMPAIELMIALKLEGDVFGVVFSPKTERAFSVGSSENAGFRLRSGQAKAIEFYLERQDDYLLLQPGYRGRDLRVNGVAVTGPEPLPERSRLEFGPFVLMARIYARNLDFQQESIAPDLRVLRFSELPKDCFCESTAVTPEPRTLVRSAIAELAVTAVHSVRALRLSRPEKTTVLPANLIGDNGYVPPSIVSNRSVDIAASLSAIDDNRLRVASSDASEVSPEVESNISAPSASSALGTPLEASIVTVAVPTKVESDAPKSPLMASENRKIQSCVPANPGAVREVRKSDEPNERGVSANTSVVKVVHTNDELKECDVLCGDDNSVRSASSELVSGEQRWQAPTAVYSAESLSASSVSQPSEKSTFKRLMQPFANTVLARFGISAYTKPVRLAVGGLLCGIVFVLVIVVALRTSKRSGTEAVRLTSKTQAAQSSATPNGVVGDVTNPNAEAKKSDVMNTGIVAESRETIALPLARNAVEHLVAGRHSDALRSYEKLLEQAPNDDVVRVTVRILTERLSKACDGSLGEKPDTNHCPELLP
jgi:hypothetical protein